MDASFKHRVEIPLWRIVRDGSGRPTESSLMNDVSDLEKWCRLNAGQIAEDWYRYSSRGRGMMFCFRDQVTADLFRLIMPR